ncbi:MAG: hypoxanthine phosphoribosyltransferase [Saprospirales bacterium]|nr:MAG: hypoxanthine phosphoribosyltransferase [Saprospirales bacterium]
MNELVKVHDREFEILLSREEIAARIDSMGREISAYYQMRKPVLLSVMHGAVIFASDLVRAIDNPLEMDFVRLKSYSGMESTGEVLMTQKWEKSLENREVLILEDIIDSGTSMNFLIDKLREAGAADIKIASLLFKPHAFRYEYPIAWKGFEIGNEFVVGFGLDYDGLGRNLPAIYQLKIS